MHDLQRRSSIKRGSAILGPVEEKAQRRCLGNQLRQLEAVLLDQPMVQEAAAAVQERQDGEQHLVAYVVRRPGTEMPSHVVMRDYLGSRLPSHLLPSAIVELDAFPRTANGNLDRGRLPEHPPRTSFDCGDAAEMPSNEVERTLQSIWQR